MMKLSTMRALVTTLNDRWESPIAKEIISYWEHDPGTARFLRASANFLFLFKRSGQDYVLRFIHASERTPDSILAEIAYLNHLSSKGIRVAKPVRSLAYHFVESIATEQGVFHAAVFERLVGEQLDLPDLTPALVTQWGQALGALHTAAQGYPGAGRPTWEDHLALVAGSLPEEELAARTTLNQLQEDLSHLPIHNDNFGLIHFDYELDNLIWNNDQIGIIDFDDSARYWFVADIAFALRDAFGDSAGKVNLRNEIAHHFIDGYRTARSIDREELELIPLFLKWHNLITFVKLQRTLETDEHHDEPLWLTELREKLRIKMAYYRDEFSQALQ